LTPTELGAQVRDVALRLGFAAVGAVPVGPPDRFDLYRSWLAAGHHGEMAYLASPEHLAARADLRALLAAARTVVVAVHPYPAGPPRPAGRGAVARYARGTDYHIVVRDKLVALGEAIARAAGRAVASRVCVDSAPVLERELAQRAGLGFAGKNTLLITRGVGSYTVLGELLLDVDLEIDGGGGDRVGCGSCRACLDACPTGAFVAERVLDARRCISYLTIESEAAIPEELRPRMGPWIFGCDVCQEVCPYNASTARAPTEPREANDIERGHPDLVALAAAPSNQLRRFVRRTALRRVDRARLLRNVCVALGNLGDADALPALTARLDDPSPLVREHAAWAIAEITRRTT
jgi:epoxyqueuosine reductase